MERRGEIFQFCGSLKAKKNNPCKEKRYKHITVNKRCCISGKLWHPAYKLRLSIYNKTCKEKHCSIANFYIKRHPARETMITFLSQFAKFSWSSCVVVFLCRIFYVVFVYSTQAENSRGLKFSHGPPIPPITSETSLDEGSKTAKKVIGESLKIRSGHKAHVRRVRRVINDAYQNIGGSVGVWFRALVL